MNFHLTNIPIFTVVQYHPGQIVLPWTMLMYVLPSGLGITQVPTLYSGQMCNRHDTPDIKHSHLMILDILPRGCSHSQYQDWLYSPNQWCHGPKTTVVVWQSRKLPPGLIMTYIGTSHSHKNKVVQSIESMIISWVHHEHRHTGLRAKYCSQWPASRLSFYWAHLHRIMSRDLPWNSHILPCLAQAKPSHKSVCRCNISKRVVHSGTAAENEDSKKWPLMRLLFHDYTHSQRVGLKQ